MADSGACASCQYFTRAARHCLQALLDGTMPANPGGGAAAPRLPRHTPAPASRGHSGSGAGSAGQAGADQPPASSGRAAAAGGAAAVQSATSPRGRKRLRAAAGVEEQEQQQEQPDAQPSRRQRQQKEPAGAEEIWQANQQLDRQGEGMGGRACRHPHVPTLPCNVPSCPRSHLPFSPSPSSSVRRHLPGAASLVGRAASRGRLAGGGGLPHRGCRCGHAGEQPAGESGQGACYTTSPASRLMPEQRHA